MGSHWMALYMKGNYIMYFGRFGIEYIPTKIIGNKNIIANILILC